MRGEPCSRGSVVLGVGILCLAATALGRARHPQFRSVPTTVKTFENDTVLLPCYVENLGDNIVRWWWNARLLADSHNRSVELPSRMKLWPNNTLQVTDVRPEDTGEYTCQVVRPIPWGPIQQVHGIEVLVPPTASPIPDTGEMEVVLGKEVEIGCETTGVPKPMVSWTFKGDELPLLDHRARLRFIAENRSLSGVYTCTVSNGVGDPASAQVHLTVLYTPEVKIDRTWVHASPGNRVVLSCEVEADPSAKVVWLKDGEEFPASQRVTAFSNQHTHSLLFRKVEKNDFGMYTCKATNIIGSGKKTIHLSGVAHPAVFKTDPRIVPVDNLTLVWEVESLSPIIEYRLLFRRYNSSQQGRWSELVIPADVGLFAPGQLHSKAYTLSGLAPATIYETTLLSRNTFGWSKPSSVLRFATEGADLEEKQLIEESIPQLESNLLPAEVAAILKDINNGVTPLVNLLLLGLSLIISFLYNSQRSSL